jgi:pilus assembly protein CpaF
MLLRLESMVLQAAGFPIDAIRSQIGEALDILVHLGKMGSGSRRVLEISELAGVAERGYVINRLFAYAPGKGLLPTGNGLIHRNKLLLLEERGRG